MSRVRSLARWTGPLALVLATLVGGPLVPPIGAALAQDTAAAAETVTVEVSGIGATPDDATKNAFRMAVQQAVGMIVDEKTVIENEQVISDKVLTYSDGYIHRWEALEAPAPARELGGLYRTRIRAEVMRGEVRRNLEAIPALRTAFEGAQEWAKLVSRAQSVEDGRALLIEFNKRHPVSKLMVTRIIDETGKTGSAASPRQELNVDQGTTTLHFGIQVYQNLDYYFTQYAPDLLTLLEKVADPVTEKTVHKDWQGYDTESEHAGIWRYGLMFLRTTSRVADYVGFERGEVVGYRGYVLDQYARKGVNPEQCRSFSGADGVGRAFSRLMEAAKAPGERQENMSGGMREPATTLFVPVKRNTDGSEYYFKLYDLRAGYYAGGQTVKCYAA
jgi:hypothetical protein